MRRLVIVFILTIVVGVGIYLISTMIFNQEEKKVLEEKETEPILFDDSYSKEITIDHFEEEIKNNEQMIIFIGRKEEEATKKVSNVLKKVENIDELNVYYLEKEEKINEQPSYQNLLSTYKELSNYMNFTPVILVFKNNTFIGGLPVEVEEKNLLQFLEYTEVLK